MFQGRDLSKTLNIAVSSRALFDLKEEHDTFETKGLDEYIKMQVEKENVVLSQGSAFPFIKVNMILYITNPRQKNPAVNILINEITDKLESREF